MKKTLEIVQHINLLVKNLEDFHKLLLKDFLCDEREEKLPHINYVIFAISATLIVYLRKYLAGEEV